MVGARLILPRTCRIDLEAKFQPQLHDAGAARSQDRTAVDDVRRAASAFVVDTVGSDERTWLDAVGHPHSVGMKVQERYTRVGHNTLEMTMTIYEIFRDHERPFPWLPNQDLVEEMCVPSLMQEYLSIIADPASAAPGK